MLLTIINNCCWHPLLQVQHNTGRHSCFYHFSGCGTDQQLCKIFDNNRRGWLHCLQYSVQFSLTWSGGVTLPNNGVSLYLQKWVDLNYFIIFVVLRLAPVLNSCLENIGVLIFLFWGLRMGPQSFQNCAQPCTTASTLRLT